MHDRSINTSGARMTRDSFENKRPSAARSLLSVFMTPLPQEEGSAYDSRITIRISNVYRLEISRHLNLMLISLLSWCFFNRSLFIIIIPAFIGRWHSWAQDSQNEEGSVQIANFTHSIPVRFHRLV